MAADFKVYLLRRRLIDVGTFHSMTRQQAIRAQAEQANHEAIQGGKDGAIRWFLGGVIVFGTAQLVWPFYRRLTTPFKVRNPAGSANDRPSFYAQVTWRQGTWS